MPHGGADAKQKAGLQAPAGETGRERPPVTAKIDLGRKTLAHALRAAVLSSGGWAHASALGVAGAAVEL